MVKNLLFDNSHGRIGIAESDCDHEKYTEVCDRQQSQMEEEEVAAAVVNEDLVVEEEPTDKITTTETEDEKNDLTLQVGGKEVKKIPIVNINR